MYTVCTSTCSGYLLLHAAIPWPTTYITFILPSNTITTFAQRQPKKRPIFKPKAHNSSLVQSVFPLLTAQLLLVVLCCNDAVLLNLALVHIAQRRHQLQRRCRGRGRKPLDDVVLICNLTYTPSSAADSTYRQPIGCPSRQILPSLHLPFAFRIASLLCSTISSGVSFGQLMMTLRCGASPMATVANSETTSGIKAVRIV